MRQKPIEADGETKYLEDTPIVDISGQTIASMDTLVDEMTVRSQKITAAGFMLPLPEITSDHNKDMRLTYGYKTPVLEIVSDRSLTFQNKELKFSNSKYGARPTLFNFIMAYPQRLFALPHLANFASSMPNVVNDYEQEFERLPLLRRVEVGGRDYIGLGRGIIMLDSRPDPSQKLSDEKYKNGGLKIADSVDAYGATSRFVNKTELEVATKEEAVIKIARLREVNEETKRRLAQSQKPRTPNQLTVLADNRVLINGDPYPTGAVAQRILNRLLASYHGSPKTIDQIVSADSKEEKRRAEEFLIQHRHMNWFAFATIENKNCIGLKPVVITDRR